MSEEKNPGICVAKMGEMSIFVSLKNEAFRQNVLLAA